MREQKKATLSKASIGRSYVFKKQLWRPKTSLVYHTHSFLLTAVYIVVGNGLYACNVVSYVGMDQWEFLTLPKKIVGKRNV